MDKAALSHLRVVELCDAIQGLYCGKMFSDWGASVLTVEPPGGSAKRRARPVVAGRDGDVSLIWEYLGGGKESVALDVASTAGREALFRLAGDADVFVTDWKPRRLREAALDLAEIEAATPELVVLAFSPFGTTGPYSEYEGTDLIAEAVSGFASFNGEPGRPPLKTAANVIAYACGASGFIGALAALQERRRSGRGQVVESAYAEAIASVTPYLRAEYSGVAAVRTGTVSTGNNTYPCRDGYVYFSLVAERAWSDFLLVMGIDAADAPEDLRTPEGRQNAERLRAFIEDAIKDRSARELFTLLNTVRITTGVLFTPEDLCRDPHLQARGFLQQMQHPRLGRVIVPGAPGRLSETPMLRPRPAPGLGEHSEWPSRGARPAAASTDERLSALSHLRVVDLTQAWVGPYASMLLADLGAEVIKVESPARPDVWRGAEIRARAIPPGARPGAHRWNVNTNFNSVNRNKRSLTLDLDTDRGKELFRSLVSRAGLVMENYTPRVMDNFGLGYEQLRAVKPDLVMVSFSGFGATGPYSDFRAIGASTEMHGGWDSLFGYPDRPPMMHGAMFADSITGLQMAAMTLVALEHREETGRGQRVEGSMFEAAVAYIGEEVMRASIAPAETRPRANRHPDMAPHAIFPCAGDDRWIAIAVRDEDDWQRFVDAADLSELREGRFGTMEARLENVDALEAIIGAWTVGLDTKDLMRTLQAAGVPAGIVQSNLEVLEDEHFREWFIPMDHPDMGVHRYNGFAWRMSRSPLVARNGPPRLGEHTRELLREEFGLSDAEVEALFAEGVTGEVFEKAEDEQAAAG